jgi:hypothetical protein
MQLRRRRKTDPPSGARLSKRSSPARARLNRPHPPPPTPTPIPAPSPTQIIYDNARDVIAEIQPNGTKVFLETYNPGWWAARMVSARGWFGNRGRRAPSPGCIMLRQ